MAATAAITANYEIIITWKVYKLETTFLSRPISSMVRNAMKLTFAFYDHSVYHKIQNERLNTYSHGVILEWELQIDGSI